MESLIESYFVRKGMAIRENRVVMPFHKTMFDAIDRWIKGELPGGRRNLSINIPPRHTKTTLARDVVELTMGLWPDSEYIYTSYASQLAIDQTVKIRSVVDSEWYREMFFDLHRLSPTEGRQDYFRTVQGGCVLGVGAGGTITGFGAGKKRPEFGGAIIIDDPLKADDARSETELRNVREWFSGVLMSRRNNDRTPMLMIAQRLHPDDLVGHIKATMADDWHFLEIPAVNADNTETIWPETFSLESAMRLKEIDPFAYYAQYQQTPIIPGGSLIKEEWWKYYASGDEKDAKVFIMTADTAYGTKDANDYSVIQYWGLSSEKMYLLDQIRGKWGYEDLLSRVVRFWNEKNKNGNRVDRLYIENKASGLSLLGQARTFRREGVNAFPWEAGKFVKDGDTKHDKVARVNQAKLSIYAGNVLLPDDNRFKWVGDFVSECTSFTADDAHSHDDQVDAMTMAVLIWQALMEGKK